MILFELDKVIDESDICEFYKHFRDGIGIDLPQRPDFRLNELMAYAKEHLGGTARLYVTYDEETNTFYHGIHIQYDRTKLPNGKVLELVMIELCKKFGIEQYKIWDGWQVAVIDSEGDLCSWIDMAEMLEM